MREENSSEVNSRHDLFHSVKASVARTMRTYPRESAIWQLEKYDLPFCLGEWRCYWRSTRSQKRQNAREHSQSRVQKHRS